MSIARITVIRLHETPKFLLGQGRDEDLVHGFRNMAAKYNRPCSITVEQLQACGTITSAHGTKGRFSPGEVVLHIRGLFANRNLALSTSLIWLSWTLIGLAYPLFYVFLPQYLATRGSATGQTSAYYTWRNYMLSSVTGVFGPVLAGFLCNLEILGRRYTMVIGALLTMVFFFAYTGVATAAENVGFSCAISFTLNVYYGTLYAYTPEVLPSAHRTTGNGIAVACNRIMGLLSAVIATVANTATTAPIYICATLYIGMVGASKFSAATLAPRMRSLSSSVSLTWVSQAIVAVLMPFEPYGRRSM